MRSAWVFIYRCAWKDSLGLGLVQQPIIDTIDTDERVRALHHVLILCSW
ncbi:MAG: hypothetical protein RMN25_02910 [Anaerolineae bacterium]|nr:hypothetical protein [Thermoflexales bacterium]MDW8406707.1 hypothetical protein [Anaerolineae bacterium]